MAGCKHSVRMELHGWNKDTYRRIHKIQSDPDWAKGSLRHLSGRQYHELQTYRLAVRQGCRERGLPVRLK